MKHELKISPEYFDAVESGVKPFEVRKNDREFKVGDTLHLREYNGTMSPYSEAPYTGRETSKTITYILNNVEYCLAGYVILGLK